MNHSSLDKYFQLFLNNFSLNILKKERLQQVQSLYILYFPFDCRRLIYLTIVAEKQDTKILLMLTSQYLITNREY